MTKLKFMMNKKSFQLMKNARWKFTIGTSGIITSGVLAYKLYNILGKRKNERNYTSQVSIEGNSDLIHEDNESIDQSEFFYLNEVRPDRFNLSDEIPSTPESTEQLKSILPRHLRKPWRLLHQANTGEREKHLIAVKELSSLRLSEGELRQLAQGCAPKTGVGLARSKGADPGFFLRPPPLPPEIQGLEIIEILYRILLDIPRDTELHECIRHFTTSALEHYLNNSEDCVLDTDITSEFFRESHHMHSIPRPSINQEAIIERSLLAILSLSTVEQLCQFLLKTPLLPLLTLIVETYRDNFRLKSLIGKIVANLSLSPENQQAIFRSGLVGLLASFKNSDNLLVSLPASRALANLDQEFGASIFHPGIYLLLPKDRHVLHSNELSNWGVDVVFVHGLWGGAFFTWRQANPSKTSLPLEDIDESVEDCSSCWPKDWLQDDSDHLRVLACDFDSYISQWGLNCPTQNFKRSLDERSEDLLHQLLEAGVGRRPVIFVGHSMGGLIIKKMLTAASESDSQVLKMFAQKTKGVVFYSTPHFGSHIAKMNSVFKYFFFPSIEVQELEIDNPFLLELNNSFKSFVEKFRTKVVSFGEAIPCRQFGLDLTFVPLESSNPGVGEFLTVPFNHMDICKPVSKKSVLFRKLHNMIWDVLDVETPYE